MICRNDDHDFLADTAELKTYKFKIKERSDLDQSVSLWFDEYCTKAAGAQIAFTIAFGEASVNYSYGILDKRYISLGGYFSSACAIPSFRHEYSLFFISK